MRGARRKRGSQPAFQELRSGGAKRVAPFVAALEDAGLDVRHTLQKLQVFLELLIVVPVVANSSAEKYGRDIRCDVRREVAAQNHEPRGFLEVAGRAVGHRHPLREPGENHFLLLVKRFDHATDVRDVVRNRQLAILAGHPVGDDLLTAACIKRMQRLNGYDSPRLYSANLQQLLDVDLGSLREAMKADQEPFGRSGA